MIWILETRLNGYSSCIQMITMTDWQGTELCQHSILEDINLVRDVLIYCPGMHARMLRVYHKQAEKTYEKPADGETQTHRDNMRPPTMSLSGLRHGCSILDVWGYARLASTHKTTTSCQELSESESSANLVEMKMKQDEVLDGLRWIAILGRILARNREAFFCSFELKTGHHTFNIFSFGRSGTVLLETEPRGMASPWKRLDGT